MIVIRECEPTVCYQFSACRMRKNVITRNEEQVDIVVEIQEFITIDLL